MTEFNPLTEKMHLKEIRHPMVDPISAMHIKKGKIATAEEAIELIRDNDTIVTAGFAEELAIALKDQFLKAGKPGNLTHVGFSTFIDPRFDGGKLNELTKTQSEDLITVMNVDGKDYLLSKPFPIHVAFLQLSVANTECQSEHPPWKCRTVVGHRAIR